MVIGSKELVDLLAQSIAMFEVDMQSGIINWASLPLELMFGYRLPGDLEGQLIEVLIPENVREKHAKEHRPAFAAAPGPRMMGRKLTLLGRRQDGSSFPVEVMLLPKAVNRIRVVIGIVFDMSDRQTGVHNVGPTTKPAVI